MRYSILLAAFIMGATAYAGTNPGDFLYAPFDPASATLGGASELLRGGASAALRSPGIVGSMETREVFLAHTFLSLNRRLDAAAVALPIGERGVLAVAGLQAAVDNIDGRDFNGRHTEYLSDTRNAVSFVFGFRPSTRVSVGIGLKALFRETAEEQASGSAFDIGTRVILREGIAVALAGRNLGIMHPQGKPMGAYWPWNTSFWSDELQIQKDDRIPPAIALSAAASSLPWGILVGLEIDKIEGENVNVSGGVQFPVDDRLRLRAGGTFDSPALGVSVLAPFSATTLTVDYSWSTGELTGDDIHRVSVASRF